MQTIVTAQIERIDKCNETVAFKLADGNLQVVKVQDPTNLEKVKIGDTIIITITKEIAISVQKTNKENNFQFNGRAVFRDLKWRSILTCLPYEIIFYFG